MLSLPVWILAALLVARLTRLITDDKITLGLRKKLIPVRGLLDWVECPWCVSVWAGAGVYVFAGLATNTPLTWFAAISSVAAWSLFAGIAGTLLERLDQPPLPVVTKHDPDCPLAGEKTDADTE